ncbi:MAG: hypothetical protein CMH50_10200 [Myxococcales bacterium]|nr:hypothetical protein [Myxococcales bacterium]
MKLFTTCCLLLLSGSVFGQDPPPSNGAVNPATNSNAEDSEEAGPQIEARVPAVTVLTARQTAHLLPAGVSQWGLFGPYTRGLKGGLELELRPLVFTLMASPNAVVRGGVHRQGLWRIAAEGGLSIPTMGMKMWQGGEDNPLPLPVSLYGRADTIPWILVPRVGLIASRGTLDSDVLTLRADLSMAVQAGEGSFNATEHWLLGLLLAPVDTGYRARLGATYDRLIHDRVRLRTSLDLYTHGAQPDRLRALGKVGIEIAAWRSSAGRWRRVGLGVGWLNSDTYAVNADRQRVRSNDFLPLFDIVF